MRFVKGLFQESLYPVSRLAFILAAGWSFTSMPIFIPRHSFVLRAMDRFLSAGSVLMFDEFYDLSNEFAAFRDYTKAFYRNCTGVAYTTAYCQAAFCIADHQRPPSTHSIYHT